MDPLRNYRRKNHALFLKKNKSEVDHETIKEKTEEYLKRGGKVTKLHSIDSIIDFDDLNRRQDIIHGSDEKWWIIKNAIKPN